MAFGIGPGDEVITPTYSFFATAGCVVASARSRCSSTSTRHLQHRRRSGVAAMTPRTKAIMPVHLFGQTRRDGAARRHRRARGHRGHRRRGAGDRRHVSRPAGRQPAARLAASRSSRARISARSATPGSSRRTDARAGGEAAAAPHPRHGAEVLPPHGRRQFPPRCDPGGGAARQAAALRAWSEARRRNAARYRALFADAGSTTVCLPVEAPDRTHIYNQFVIRVPHRDGCARISMLPASAPRCITRCHSTCSTVSPTSATRPGAFPDAEAAAASHWRCRSIPS